MPDYGQVQMARMQTQDGAMYTIDLGLRRNLPSGFSLNQDSWIQVTGQLIQSGNQQMLVADTLTRSPRIR